MFNFDKITIEEFVKEIDRLDPKQSSTGVTINLLKENLIGICNSCILKEIYSNELKVADITPILKSLFSIAKKKYRPLSTLKSTSKLSERVIQSQLNTFFHKKLSQHLCGYREG